MLCGQIAKLHEKKGEGMTGVMTGQPSRSFFFHGIDLPGFPLDQLFRAFSNSCVFAGTTSSAVPFQHFREVSWWQGFGWTAECMGIGIKQF